MTWRLSRRGPTLRRGSASPNHTTPGRSGAPHVHRGGNSGSGTRVSRAANAQRVQRRSQISPWTLIVRALPAASCSPSTFCVTSVKPGARFANDARASWAGFGRTAAIC